MLSAFPSISAARLSSRLLAPPLRFGAHRRAASRFSGASGLSSSAAEAIKDARERVWAAGAWACLPLPLLPPPSPPPPLLLTRACGCPARPLILAGTLRPLSRLGRALRAIMGWDDNNRIQVAWERGCPRAQGLRAGPGEACGWASLRCPPRAVASGCGSLEQRWSEEPMAIRSDRSAAGWAAPPPPSPPHVQRRPPPLLAGCARQRAAGAPWGAAGAGAAGAHPT